MSNNANHLGKKKNGDQEATRKITNAMMLYTKASNSGIKVAKVFKMYGERHVFSIMS